MATTTNVSKSGREMANCMHYQWLYAILQI